MNRLLSHLLALFREVPEARRYPDAATAGSIPVLKSLEGKKLMSPRPWYSVRPRGSC